MAVVHFGLLNMLSGINGIYSVNKKFIDIIDSIETHDSNRDGEVLD